MPDRSLTPVDLEAIRAIVREEISARFPQEPPSLLDINTPNVRTFMAEARRRGFPEAEIRTHVQRYYARGYEAPSSSGA